MSSGDAFASWLEQWLAARPEMRLVELYCRPARAPRMRALGVLEHLLREAAFGVREPAVARNKLAWWGEELLASVRGAPRHPVTRELVRLCDAAAIHALVASTSALVDACAVDSSGDVDALVARYAGAAAQFALAYGAAGDHGRVLAVSWLIDELRSFARFVEPAHARVPLVLLARHATTRAALARDPDAPLAAQLRADLAAALAAKLNRSDAAGALLSARLVAARTWAKHLARAERATVVRAPRLQLVYALWRARC